MGYHEPTESRASREGEIMAKGTNQRKETKKPKQTKKK